MKVISKYLYIELLKPFLIFSFTFIGILWLVQILPKLETLVLNKQPLGVFFNVAMHTIPQVAYFVIPVAAFFSTACLSKPTTIETLSDIASVDERICSRNDFPASVCRTFAFFESILVPFPPARSIVCVFNLLGVCTYAKSFYEVLE